LPERKRKITLIRSLIGRSPKQVRTLQALGLRKIRQSVVHPQSESLRGMLATVGPFVKVEEVKGS